MNAAQQKKRWSTPAVKYQLCNISGDRLITKGRGGLVIKISDRSWLVRSSNPVPLKTRRVGERCTLNLSRAQTSSRWCDVVVRRGGASSGVVLTT
ncbi:hypothetical protein TNCV_4506761 [Trichonephila clavipes]|nr:hypothetical protein TNCV_4506761 [Trichonephila clavipes]